MERSRLHLSLQQSEFTLDDVSFAPEKIPNFEVKEVDLTTRLTERITLKSPLISSPMDTVTGYRMATLLALHGGIGVIHFNYPAIEDQMREVERVRRYEAGFVRNPVVVGPDATVGTINNLGEKNGFFSYPITADGTLEGLLIGIVTHRDIRFLEDPNVGVVDIMTYRDKLVVARKEETLDKGDIKAANQILRACKLDTLPIVDEDGRVVALVTDSDLEKDKKFPLATKDENKQLKVLVAVESRFGSARERIIAARDFGASGIVVDSRNIFADHLKIAEFTKKEAPELDVILGNVVTTGVIRQVMEEAGGYIDGFRVGIGTGEVCITTESLGIGRTMGSSIHAVEEALRYYQETLGRHIGIIADGGIKSPSHIVAAMILGADAVMMGSELAGLDESPIPAHWDSDRVMLVKRVRGMGSAAAISERAGASRYGLPIDPLYGRVAEGTEKIIPYKGPGGPVLTSLFSGIRQSMHGLGMRSVEELHNQGTIIPYKRSLSKGTT